MPLPLSSRNYLEAQRRITKTIVISGNSFSCTVADALHQFMVIVGEVPALEFSRENIMTLLKIVEGCSSLWAIVLSCSEITRWRAILKKARKYVQVKLRCHDEISDNPLITTIVDDPITGRSCIIKKMNAFRSNAIEQLKMTGKLNTQVQALSLNGIIFISKDQYRDYQYDSAKWALTCRKIRKNLHMVKVSELDKHIITGIIGEISALCGENCGQAKRRLKEMRNEFEEDGSVIDRCLAMLESLVQKVSGNWMMANMTEDSLAMNILDPVLNAYINNDISGIQYNGSDYELPESRKRKMKQAASQGCQTDKVRGRKPDRSGSVNDKHVFLVMNSRFELR
ncbi:hypothetical protein PS15m_004655 [Mucor circinelloides]